ncbi:MULTISPECIES: RNA polymerase-binding protein DksA [Zoogloea]|jgi:DnaK suppressor protein|uniref:RNA polymerase-binding transcription factor DksA n=1 Tax=Zoogloea dura TaxID=2728840 RepID=A0A848G2X9_9RHOO|nr:RNA polymerase-binding protein DksA [Zoogloea dura]KAB2964579.1 MAG: RNA polymerase-binding protein DksA [Zoogloea sp.]NML26557.1 RNA polymerase-binding protein DksA [Zoogloea dura]
MVATTSNEKLLTEAEILAMSEDDYMNPAQLEFFRVRLSTMRDELLENAASTGANLRENELVADPADRATVEEEHALELRVRDRERKLLKKIDEALGRISEGEYGWCEETGDPIGIGRLLARPTATLSIDAQERRERTQKLYGE